MADLIVKDKNNVPIGYVRTSDTEKQAINYNKGYVGYYSIFSDITFDKNGKIYCYGDGTTSLVRDASK